MTKKSRRELDFVTVPAQTAFLPAASPAPVSISKAGAPASINPALSLPNISPGDSAWDTNGI